AQEFRTYPQSGQPGRIQVDLKADFSVLPHKTDHTAGFGKMFALAHSQHGFAADFFQNGRESAFFRIADEKDVALGEVIVRDDLADEDWPPIHDFGLHGLLKAVAEVVLAHHADDEWGIGIGEGFRGPVHVFGEIEEEERLDLVFGVTGITREDGSRGEQGADHRQDQHRRPDAVCAGRRRLRDVAGRSHSEYPGYLPVDGARHLADDWAALAVELSVAILEEVL